MSKISLTNTYTTYPAYKDSGVEWIGQIPQGWNIELSKRIFNELNLRGEEGLELGSVTQERGVVLRSTSDLSVWNPQGELGGYKTIREGQFVLSLRSFEGGVELSGVDALVSPAYTVMELDVLHSKKYFKWLLKSNNLISALQVHTRGIRQGKNISFEDFAKIDLPIPPKAEQEKIARFLDEQVERIDTTIAKKQRLIELLKEKRTATINHAVTKGLDPNAELVDSGIDWIGKIPKHWMLKKLKSGFKFEKGKEAGKFTQMYVSDEANAGEYPVYSGQTENDGILGKINTYKYNFPDGVLFSTTVGAKAMTVKFLQDKFSLSQNCVLMVPLQGVDAEYFFYLLEIGFMRMRDEIPSHMQPSLRVSDLNKFTVLFPPLDEQKNISDHLNQQLNEYDLGLEKIKHTINLLQELKSSLISHAVTGKIKV